MLGNSANVFRIFTVALLLSPKVCRSQRTKIDRAITDWAPLIIFEETEEYFPLSIEEFLEHVYPARSDGKPVGRNSTKGVQSQNIHYRTKDSLEELQSTKSFLNGHNPEKFSVPIYVIVKECENEDWKGSRRSAEGQISFMASYWLFFPFNEGKEVCLLGAKIPVPKIFKKCLLGKTKKFGNHVGDFEHLTITFDANYEPIEMFVSAHHVGSYYEYGKQKRIFSYSRQRKSIGFMQNIKYPTVVRLERKRPVLYAAKGSHGLWGEQGLHKYHKLPNLYDKTGYGVKWKTWENINIYHVYSKEPDWMQFFGRWGNPKSNCYLFGFCEFSEAPHGILDRPDDFNCHK